MGKKTALVAATCIALLAVAVVCLMLAASEDSKQSLGPHAAREATLDPKEVERVSAIAEDSQPEADQDSGEGPSAESPPTVYPVVPSQADVGPLAALLDVTKDDTTRNEIANSLRGSAHAGLTNGLVRILNNPEEGPRFRSFCIQHLCSNYEKAGPAEGARIIAVLRIALRDHHVKVRREALLSLVKIGDQKGRDATIAWLTQEAGGHDTRDIAIRCARIMGLKEHTATIRQFLRSQDEVIRIAAVVTLSQWGDEQSRPAFEEAAKSQSHRLRRAGEAALERLDRAKMPASDEGASEDAGVTPPDQIPQPF